MNLDWQDSALCAQIGADPFFPNAGEGGRAAKRTCRRCEVRTECLEYALDQERGLERGLRSGVWGGLGPGARARLDHTAPAEEAAAA